MIIVDTHPHLYSEDDKKYPPIENPYRPPEGTGTLEHLCREMAANRVSKAVLIQTSTYYRWDQRFICDTVVADPERFTGVVTPSPDNPHSPDLLWALVKRYGIRGMRSIVAADGQFDCDGVHQLWKVAGELGVVVNPLLSLDRADQLAGVLERFPDQPVVLDHCLNLNVGPSFTRTLDKVLELARYPNLVAKLTNIPTGSAEEFPCSDLHDIYRRIIDTYTPDRCVWGSAFPCELWCPKVTYGQHLQIFTNELGLDEEEKAAILGRTAMRLWFEGRE
ncbi:MAG: amidohydrolase family protein [Planctomycetota bacterium]|nr:amidohydrolase family protein [Planctomycetota bacterium]